MEQFNPQKLAERGDCIIPVAKVEPADVIKYCSACEAYHRDGTDCLEESSQVRKLDAVLNNLDADQYITSKDVDPWVVLVALSDRNVEQAKEIERLNLALLDILLRPNLDPVTARLAKQALGLE